MECNDSLPELPEGMGCGPSPIHTTSTFTLLGDKLYKDGLLIGKGAKTNEEKRQITYRMVSKNKYMNNQKQTLYFDRPLENMLSPKHLPQN